jgi:hypothetical protein
VVDGRGLPLRLVVSPGQASDKAVVAELIKGLPPACDIVADLPDLEPILSGEGEHIEFPTDMSARYAVCVGLAMRCADENEALHAFTWLDGCAGFEPTRSGMISHTRGVETKARSNELDIPQVAAEHLPSRHARSGRITLATTYLDKSVVDAHGVVLAVERNVLVSGNILRRGGEQGEVKVIEGSAGVGPVFGRGEAEAIREGQRVGRNAQLHAQRVLEPVVQQHGGAHTQQPPTAHGVHLAHALGAAEARRHVSVVVVSVVAAPRR